MKYNYVVFMTQGPFEYMFKDLEKMENVKVFWKVGENRNIVSRLLMKIHFNRIVNIPGKWIWFNKFFKRNDFNKYFKDERPIIFVVRAGYDFEFIKTNSHEYLKSNYKDCKFVMPILDTVASCYKRNKEINNYQYDIEEMKNMFDLIVTGNPKDVNDYDLNYYPEPFSTTGVKIDVERKYDVFFIGAAKDRLDTIHSVYQKLVENNINCDFWIVGVDESKQISGNIKYNQPLQYKDMLKRACMSNAILEIVQQGTTGFTIRAYQALINNQKYITNAEGIKSSKYYDADYMLQFSDVSEISTNWIKNNVNVDYKYDDDYSPCEFIKFIDNYFGEKDPDFKVKWQN